MEEQNIIKWQPAFHYHLIPNKNKHFKFTSFVEENQDNESLALDLLYMWEIMDFRKTPLQYEGFDVIARDRYYPQRNYFDRLKEFLAVTHSWSDPVPHDNDYDWFASDCYFPRDGTALIANIIPHGSSGGNQKITTEDEANAELIAAAPLLLMSVIHYLCHYTGDDPKKAPPLDDAALNILYKLDKENRTQTSSPKPKRNNKNDLGDYTCHISVEELMRSAETEEKKEQMALRISNLWTYVATFSDADENGDKEFLISSVSEDMKYAELLAIVPVIENTPEKLEEAEANAVLISLAPTLHVLLDQFVRYSLNNIELEPDSLLIRTAEEVVMEIAKWKVR